MAVVTVIEVIIVMVTTPQEQVILVAHNPAQITNVIMPTDINLMLHGVQGAMVLVRVTEVLEVEKVLS